MGVQVHALVGNHTAYFKNTNLVNTLVTTVGEYDNVTIYTKATEVEIGGLPILFIPWINEENHDETYDLIKKSKCPVAMGHLELQWLLKHIEVTLWIMVLLLLLIKSLIRYSQGIIIKEVLERTSHT